MLKDLRLLLTSALLVLALTGATPSAAAERTKPPRATLATFSGLWLGHTRRLTITPSGRAREHIDDGCCSPVISLSFQLLQPQGTTDHARVSVRVTSVKLYNETIYWENRARPRVGQQGWLRLKANVLAESFTGVTFCRGRTSRCGA
ncbi:MAG: hypothetical protein H0T97_00620 [Actinobacteria bacterium]|nr:hypothetical protein [Actinomycetota bacterium]